MGEQNGRYGPWGRGERVNGEGKYSECRRGQVKKGLMGEDNKTGVGENWQRRS